MKFAISVACLVHAATIIAAPTLSPQADAPTGLAVSDSLPNDANSESAAGPPTWRLDCGSPGTTSMCSASNSGAHCDPITGSLTIILEGTCGGCRCISTDQCTSRCG